MPVILLYTLLIFAVASPAFSAAYILENTFWLITIDPATLEVTAAIPGHPVVALSSPQPPQPVDQFHQTSDSMSWHTSHQQLRVTLNGPVLRFESESIREGTVTWPALKSIHQAQALILPIHEGVYIPSEDTTWAAYLSRRSPFNTTFGLSMPLLGLEFRDFSLTYLFTQPYNNQLEFSRTTGGIGLQLTHEYTPIQREKRHSVQVRLGISSPVEPARQYRSWLQETGAFVPLKDKIQATPKAQRLLGAVHMYLWGSGMIGIDDVIDWRRLTAAIREGQQASAPQHLSTIWNAMEPDIRQAIQALPPQNPPHQFLQNQIISGLNNALEKPGLFAVAFPYKDALPADMLALQSLPPVQRDAAAAVRLNCRLLAGALPGCFTRPDAWGQGVSPKMLRKFAALGFDKLWLGLDGYEEAARHPEAVRLADSLGYLLGPYDSYHSIHHPDETNTWATAQFDLHLYETGGVIRRDGSKSRGFQGKGFHLSSLAARPYLERRVNRIMHALPFNSWFIDCDATGEVFDDYSPGHTATQEEDMRERLDRMAWIRDTHRLVIGSEGGHAVAAQVIHYAHGMMTPVIGWGDPELKDPASPYFTGRYYPPNGPAFFMQQTRMPERYRYLYADPRFRIPLFQTAFHDAVIATHHWSAGTLKYTDVLSTRTLLEALYNVPPLYHMNIQEFEKHKAWMQRHYAFFAPLHSAAGAFPMTKFEWLTEDRLVQKTVFGDRYEVVANFREVPYNYQYTSIAARSVLSIDKDTKARWLYTP